MHKPPPRPDATRSPDAPGQTGGSSARPRSCARAGAASGRAAAPAGADPGLYTRATMAVRYTPQVIWWRHPRVWGVANGLIHARYAALTGRVHLEVGVGNGYFLARLPSWSALEQLHLLDVNAACLSITARRLRGRVPLRAHAQSALEPWVAIGDAAADSVACHMTLHAIQRGSMAALEPLLAEARRVLAPGGMFFGSTILPRGDGVRLSAAARRLITDYNAKGIFSNGGDTRAGLRELLAAHFPRPRLRVTGCVAVWEASAP